MERRKVCIVCGEELPIDMFPTNRRMKDGHLGWCFDCFKLRGTEAGREYFKQKETEKAARLERKKEQRRRWARENAEKMREYAKKWHREHYVDPAFREKRKEYMKEYRQRPEAKEKAKAIKARYYANNVEEMRRRSRENYRKLKEKRAKGLQIAK